ncbi:MAG: hypothetical protein GKR94_05595 [Gammaproteobacteria bacterium]|nr:hypothetical protein [Gammaproteobacteria bacterium]
MGRRTVAHFASRIKRVLSPTLVNILGRRIGFCYRERLMTPYRLVLSLLASHAMGPVETLADIHRQFNALFAMTVAYKPFDSQLSKDTFQDLMREVLCVILQHWVVEVLRPKAHVQGVEVVYESPCIRYESCKYCRGSHLDRDCGIDIEALSRSDDSGIARSGELDAQSGDVCPSWLEGGVSGAGHGTPPWSCSCSARMG